MYYFFYLPVGTELRLRRVPFATLSILGLNVAAFTAALFLGRDSSFFQSLAFVPLDFQLHTLVTSTFLHAGFLHIAMNLLYLWIFGSVLEDRMGWPRYVAAYFLCGILSNMAQAVATVTLLPQNAGIPIIGASGAISGLLGLFLVRFYFVRVKVASLAVLFFQGIYRATVSRLNAGGAMLLWILIQLAYGLATSSNPLSMTAYWAHVVGFCMGLILGLAGGMGRQALLERRLIRARHYFEQGKWFASAGEAMEFLKSEPYDAEARALLARALLLTGQRRSAATEYAGAIRLELEGGSKSAAVELYAELKRVSAESALPPGPQLAVARCLEEYKRPDLAAEAYFTFGSRYPLKEKAPASLLKAGEIYCAKLNNLDKASEVYQKVRSLYPQTNWASMARRRLAEIGRIAAHRSLAPDPVTAGDRS